MIILGIDPGFHFAGFSIIKKEKHVVHLLQHGALKMSPSKSLSTRIGIFFNFFNDSIMEWKVTDIALETPFLGKNAQNFLKLGYLRGILYLLVDKYGLVLHEYSPREVKQAITGFGGASKEQVARVVLQLFPRMAVPNKLDITDALAITLCGLWKSKSETIEKMIR